MTALASAFTEHARALGLALDAPTVERLALFRSLLLRWTRSINLIAPGDVAQFDLRHLLDCLLPVRHLRAEDAVLDLGSGGGLPGLVVAALAPDRRVVLVEPLARKAAFLRRAVAALALERAVVVEQRVEDVDAPVVDVVTARAVARLGTLCALARPRVPVGGRFLFMKGREYAGELDALPSWCERVDVHVYEMPPDARISAIVELVRRA